MLDLRPRDRFVAYVIMCDMGRPDGVHTFINFDHLVKVTSFDATSVREAVVNLERAGYILPPETVEAAEHGGVILNIAKLMERMR